MTEYETGQGAIERPLSLHEETGQGVVKRPLSLHEETGDQTAERHASELTALASDHRGLVAATHELHSVPMIKFSRLTREQKIAYNMRRGRINELNRTYYRRVTETCTRHQAELASKIKTALAEKIKTAEGAVR